MLGVHYVYLVSARGLEPPTNGLKGHCSAIELRARTSPVWALCILSRPWVIVNVWALKLLI
jgi:hypothetical protein